MKKILLGMVMLTALVANSQGQVLRPARWAYSLSKPSVAVGETVDLLLTVTVDADWYIYSSDLDPDLGPTPTTFAFKPNDTYQLLGKVKTTHAPKKKYEEVWGGEISYFTGQAQFRQTVKILKPNPVIEGTSDYQVCTEKDGRCIPLNEEFKFQPVVSSKKDAAVPSETKPTKGSASIAEPKAAEPAVAAAPVDTVALAKTPPVVAEPKQAEPGAPAIVSTTPTGNAEERSTAGFLFWAFSMGLLALLTPCVYPMIPFTVSFFTGQGGSRARGIFRALLYGFSIIFIYTLIGLLFSSFFGIDSANAFSTHWLTNVVLFGILVVFGMSFLGLFDIVLPSSLATKVDTQAEKGGLYGIFFMALTLAVVSFSCTAPIAGQLLILSLQGEKFKAALGMVAYSSAFAIPFTLFAIFPTWLKSLPKSGGWLNSVKVVLGFLELALALKFLSNADQVYHWGLLDRDVFLALWIVLFALTGFYLLGKITLPHDTPLSRVSVPRLMLSILAFAFVVYLVPGLFGAPLKPLAGLLPPQTTQDFDLSATRTQPALTMALGEKPKYADFLKLPHGLPGFFDYREGLAYAKKVGKPVFLDFTGHGCVNCREMEARVWSDPQVLARLRDDYVVISLYVDERRELPESQWYTSKYDQRVKKTIGAQNFDLQLSRFGANAQPYYRLLDGDGRDLLPQALGYQLDVPAFTTFLDQGKDRFANRLAQR